MDLVASLRKNWWIFALIAIISIGYFLRAQNIVPDRLLSFDPIYQYRWTWYFANWDHLPVWDELSYYAGRGDTNSPLMWYATAAAWWIAKGMGFSLKTTAAILSALYGAMIGVSAFLLVREISNKYAGLVAAALAASAPQILIRTFGGSYDTDALVVFFILMTLFAGLYMLRKKTVGSVAFAVMVFSAAVLTWGLSVYTIFILMAYVGVRFLIDLFMKRDDGGNNAVPNLKSNAVLLVAMILVLQFMGVFANFDAVGALFVVVGFARQAEAWIVNISIAELQPFNIFNLQGWQMATGRFVTGDAVVDAIAMFLLVSLMLFGILYSFKKKDSRTLAALLTLLLVGVYTTFRGIRFTEFTSALFIVVVAVGFGCFLEWSRRDSFLRAVAIGLGALMILFTLGTGLQLGQQLGPDYDSDWENAYAFLRQTNEKSLVGTWWDPGHMITGQAERRVVADGAHCGNACLYTINDRIVDLGKIMVTSDERESLKLIRKYQGDSPEVYWIASDDLIGKFQWLMYFGTGCDARVNPQCQLYIQAGHQQSRQLSDGKTLLRDYGGIYIIQMEGDLIIPFVAQNRNAALFNEVIFYNNGKASAIPLKDEASRAQLNSVLKQYEKEIGIRFGNSTVPYSVWVPSNLGYLTLIPENLRESVFTKMFFFNGEGLENFTPVYANERVKIFRVENLDNLA